MFSRATIALGLLLGCTVPAWAWPARVCVIAPLSPPAGAAMVTYSAFHAMRPVYVYAPPLQIANVQYSTLQYTPVQAQYSTLQAAFVPLQASAAGAMPRAAEDDVATAMAKLRAEVGQLGAAVRAHSDVIAAHDAAIRGLADRAAAIEKRQGVSGGAK